MICVNSKITLDFITDLSPLELASRVAPLVREAVETVALVSESDILYNLIKDTDNQTLITELVRRGYNLSRLREDEPTTEIVKIG